MYAPLDMYKYMYVCVLSYLTECRSIEQNALDPARKRNMRFLLYYTSHIINYCLYVSGLFTFTTLVWFIHLFWAKKNWHQSITKGLKIVNVSRTGKAVAHSLTDSQTINNKSTTINNRSWFTWIHKENQGASRITSEAKVIMSVYICV